MLRPQLDLNDTQNKNDIQVNNEGFSTEEDIVGIADQMKWEEK